MGDITYLNTDLDVWAGRAVRPLVDALAARGVRALHRHAARDDDTFAVFETDATHAAPAAPEENLAEILAAIESLAGDAAAVWAGCSLRRFDVGYDCGDGPREFGNELSNDLLRRLAACGATLRVTLYPPYPPEKKAARRPPGAKKAGKAKGTKR